LNAALPPTDLQVLDVRTPGERQDGYIPGSTYIFLPELEKKAERLDKARPVAVYCDSGYRASLAASLLARMGFKDVRNVPGSWKAWKAAGYAVQKPKGAEKGHGHEPELTTSYGDTDEPCSYQKVLSPYVVGAGIGVLSWLAFWTADHPSASAPRSKPLPRWSSRPRHHTWPSRTLATRPARESRPRSGGNGCSLSASSLERLPAPGCPAIQREKRFLRSGLRDMVERDSAFPGRIAWRCGYDARRPRRLYQRTRISGALQLALSSWIFAPTFFGVGVVAAFLLYGRKGAAHV